MHPGFEIHLSTGLVETGDWSTIHHEGVSLEYRRLHSFYGGTDQRSTEGTENNRLFSDESQNRYPLSFQD